MIQDEQGNFVDRYSFQKTPSQVRGKKSKWYYFSYTDYISGMYMYPDSTGIITDILNYLIHTNDKLKLDKQFHIVEVDIDNFDGRGKIIKEEIM
jgi:hypothetical protein